MDFSKIKKIFFILLILSIVLFPFWCVRGFCSENEIETLEYSRVNNLRFDSSSNYFSYDDGGGSTFYVKMEKGYKYFINIGSGAPSARNIAISEEVPAVNVPCDFIGSFGAGSTYSYIPTEDSYFLCCFPGNSSFITFTREKIPGMNSTIDDLVSNVGINSIWNIFDISINYIVVVVLFAFGCYIIFRIIRKISRGKEGL